jgi:hypothetical protein
MSLTLEVLLCDLMQLPESPPLHETQWMQLASLPKEHNTKLVLLQKYQ